jgi:hypothetical protein
MDNGQAAREMEKVMRALENARIVLASRDQERAATELFDQPRHSPLRTLVEQAERSGEQVLRYLRSGLT